MASRNTTIKDTDPLKIREAELVIVNGAEYAFALKYSPGETPAVLIKGRLARAKDIIWAAQEFEIPIIEMTCIDNDFFVGLEEGAEISENHYRTIAQALALLYKTKSSPYRVRYIKTLKKRPSVLSGRAMQLVEKYSSFLEVSLVSLELGKELHENIEYFRTPLDSLRQRIALEVGIVIPEITARLNPRFTSFAYAIKMREVPIHEGEIEAGTEGKDYVFQIINRLRHLITRNAWQLLGYTEVEALIHRMKTYNSGLYRELFPRYFSIPALRFILRNLLKEGISIRDLSKILEVIKDNLPMTKDPDLLTELVRASFAPYLCHKYKSVDGYLEVILLDPEVEKMIMSSIRESSQVRWLDLKAEDGLDLLSSLGEELKKAQSLGLSPVLLCSPALRRFLRRLLELSFPELAVLSYNEIVPFTEVRSVGIVR
ncbi:MAG: FHIPEP family type III secretion protein [Candidatus Xenobiia bacterium LiM19]